jgi:hypothetical protein
MKKFTLSRVLDGFRSSVSQGPGQPITGPAKNQEGPLTEIVETLRPENFQLSQVCLFIFSSKPSMFVYVYVINKFNQNIPPDHLITSRLPNCQT